MCSPLAALSPAAALIKEKPAVAAGLGGGLAGLMLAKKGKPKQRYGDGTVVDGAMS